MKNENQKEGREEVDMGGGIVHGEDEVMHIS